MIIIQYTYFYSSSTPKELDMYYHENFVSNMNWNNWLWPYGTKLMVKQSVNTLIRCMTIIDVIEEEKMSIQLLTKEWSSTSQTLMTILYSHGSYSQIPYLVVVYLNIWKLYSYSMTLIIHLYSNETIFMTLNIQNLK